MILKKFPKKSLGQNFLIDDNIIKKIVNISKNIKNKTVLEIGAGSGNLTVEILSNNPKKIIAIEIDKNLSIFLKNRFTSKKNLEIVNEDILNMLTKNSFGKNVIVFGNLPYNISTQILASLIILKKWPPWYESLIFMFQKEVADRILAKNGSKEFGRLAVLCGWRLEIKKHFDVSMNCFNPKPKVNSTVLSFIPKKEIKYKIKNPKNLELVTRVMFSSRRKMINKSLMKLFYKNKSLIRNLNLDMRCRPEELSNETFYKIVENYEKIK
jgi:16S rRNA (adenine1518-N6/adenine1519-N6)-dimethyltransferase|tara:strand:- start:260 stop:1063 length:804 start_codon:yes stop_codon:yes gene_type:complete